MSLPFSPPRNPVIMCGSFLTARWTMIPLHDDNPTTINPVVTITLIVVCFLVFLWQQALPVHDQARVLAGLGVIPAVLLGGASLPHEYALLPVGATLFTSMFLHAGWMHLIGNMLYLWIFGNNIEDAMGHVRFIVFYLLCGVLAGVAHAFSEIGSEIPTIGASGAISGVLGAYLLLYPRAQVMVAFPAFPLLWRPIYLPAVVVLGFWFLLQVINSALDAGQAGGVAWLAHVGGFVAGMLLIPLFKYSHVRFFHPAHHHDDWR